MIIIYQQSKLKTTAITQDYLDLNVYTITMLTKTLAVMSKPAWHIYIFSLVLEC